LNFLLDTNVVSEWVKPRPDPNVVHWMADIEEERVFVSVITFAELIQGIEGMAAGRRRAALESWLVNDLAPRFEGRILAVDLRVAQFWGNIMARGRKKGISLGAMDAFFASTAEAHEMTLVRRDTREFERLGIAVFNPWSPVG
jgi:predicted nucleic acid-binding protein